MLNKLKIFILVLVLAGISSGCSIIPNQQNNNQKPIALQFWGVFDASDVYQDIITSYEAQHPNITVQYKKLTWAEYEQSLLEAWAEDRGPDIFLVKNDWVNKYASKISPCDSITAENVRKNFVDVVYYDAVIDGKVFGLPLSVDTLALFYNRQILDASGVVEVPTTWQELIDIVPKITRQDSDGNIVRSAIALGGTDNISNADDILSLLMMQNGTQMVNNNGQISFDKPASYDNVAYQGEKALQFYTDFALPMKQVYTWNKDLPQAKDAFLQGKTAMIFGFSYDLPYLRAQGHALDFGVAPMLHINADGTDAILGQSVNIASYWLLTAAKKTAHSKEAWNFILFAAANSTKKSDGTSEFQVEKYLQATNKPPALRALINKYSQNPDFEPFVGQILTAKSWYHGNNQEYVQLVFNQMVNDLLNGSKSVSEAIRFGARAIQSTY